MAEPTLSTHHLERCAKALEASFSTVDNRRAARIIRELAADRDRLAQVLRQHHTWHQQEGLEMKLGDEFFDCASAYCDSTLEEETTAVLLGRP